MEKDELFHPVVILCDFDGTITPLDHSNFIFMRFAASGLTYVEQWEKGLISTRQQIDLTFATMDTGPDEIVSALREIPIDPTFYELMAFVDQHDLGLAVVSDGMDWPIEMILAQHGIQGLLVYSNHMAFENGRPVCTYPWYDPLTPMSGICKPLIVRQYRDKGSRIVYIGDGRSDREAAKEADLVFAKGALADYCRVDGIAFLPFDAFTDICSQLEPWLLNFKK
ncbi:MAG TPA: MtnX-like HAD-IB family phosphatase [Longilinea sp.]|nr:MtnX-like HAD-IB family phosphatase [Longilinea sp.]